MRTVLSALMAVLCSACQQAPAVRMQPTAEMAAAASAARCRGPGGGSNRADCTIDVDIVQTGSSCTVQVRPDQNDVVFDRRVGRRWILWQIHANADGYRFTDNGISFKSGADPLGNFSDGGTGPRGQIYFWRNRNGAFDIGEYSYTISVVNTARNISCLHDPRISNR